MPTTISDEIIRFLQVGGANLVGFADLTILPAAARRDLPRAVAFAVALAPAIVAEIEDGPTTKYHAEYERVNQLLGELSRSTAELIRSRGFTAVSSAATNEGIDPQTYSTGLPHKTIATLAGFGWIGRSALLVNEQFGSAIRLNRVLTDAPLPTGTPVSESRCGNCRACVDACPGQAASGDTWTRDKRRDDFFDAFACRRAARATAQQRTGISDTFCGICIAVCPWTQAYIKSSFQMSQD
jgi:epoxyqueuosine reductase